MDHQSTPTCDSNGSSNGTSPTRVSSISTSTSGTSISQRMHLGQSLSEEAREVISDLSNFVALGCLCFEDFCKGENDDELGAWNEVTTAPVLAFDSGTSSNLSRLLESGWIRMRVSRAANDPRWLIYRVYLLYMDIGKASIDRANKRLVSAVQVILGELDISGATWNGTYSSGRRQTFDRWAAADKDDPSLFFVFNMLPSPSPCPTLIKDKYTREALEDLLDSGSSLPGLKTTLYSYQRRSASSMLQRESVSKLEIDPRLEQRVAPDGTLFYYGPRDTQFLRDPKYFETSKGGILAESPGTGKTLMTLALILSTKNHLPKVPIEYATHRIRSSVASLTDMAVATINRSSFPWKVELERIKQQRQDAHLELEPCIRALERCPPTYQIPVVPIRWNRKTVLPPPHVMTLAATTIIVVPQNLFGQWRSEISKHIEADALKVLAMDDRKKPLPTSEELRAYDIILFTRNRFDLEIKDGEDDEGRRLPHKTATVCRCPYIGSTRQRDCRCLRNDMLYVSPLKNLHFKRIIVDEGHFFSNSNTATISVVNRLITADHRWSVSGTPARDLMGVEVHMSAMADTDDSKEDILERRRCFSARQDKNGAIDSLGSLASTFLKIDPWCSAGTSSWKDHVFRHEDQRRNTFSGFSTCLRRTLENIVVKTRPEDVEKDLDLPPLSNKIVRLEPSFYDKLTANLFTLVLTANAVTSERTDADYLFHRNSSKARYQLVQNLRQSAFFWTGFSTEDVLATVKTSTGYLDKDGTNCTEDDRQLMLETLACAEAILSSDGWKTLSSSHEMGIFVDGWPAESADHWAFDSTRHPLVTGISQLLDAQSFVNHRLAQVDPGEGLAGAGIKALAAMKAEVKAPGQPSKNDSKQPSMQSKPGVPISSIDGEPALRRASLSRKSSSPKSSPKKFRVTKIQKAEARKEKAKAACDSPQTDDLLASEEPPTGQHDLAPDSPYARASIVGTASAKMSYLISQIMKYSEHEKILVFYSGDNIAYYIAQMLELLNINHEIYAKSLQNRLKSEYVVNFDQGTRTKVLLMDVNQAAFGLNLSSASRIYFVNAVCRPNVEAQAIKRAHRIGQTRNVVVETLVLKGTIEEKMLERSNMMSTDEHRDAKVLEDDGGIREIIQSARVIPITNEEQHAGRGQMAPLEEPQRLFARPNWNQQHQHGKRKRETDEPQVVVKRQRAIDVTDITSGLRQCDNDDAPARGVPGPPLPVVMEPGTDDLRAEASDKEPREHGLKQHFSLKGSHSEPRSLTLAATCKDSLQAVPKSRIDATSLGPSNQMSCPSTGCFQYDWTGLEGQTTVP